jgi:hypothetical protein
VTVRRGEDWGTAGALAPGAPVCTSDAELAALVAAVAGVAVDAGAVGPRECGLVGGDLCRTVAGPGDRDRLTTAAARRLPIDVGTVALDGGPPRPFVAHVVAGRRFRGRVVAAMNAQYVGRWDVAPRSHPNDGHLDLLDARLSPGDRWKAWRRLRLGTHVPHPSIAQRRVIEAEVDLGRTVPVRIDGRPAGRARRLELRCVPDAWTIVI